MHIHWMYSASVEKGNEYFICDFHFINWYMYIYLHVEIVQIQQKFLNY